MEIEGDMWFHSIEGKDTGEFIMQFQLTTMSEHDMQHLMKKFNKKVHVTIDTDF